MDFKQRFHERRKRAYQQGLWFNLLLLFPPVVLTAAIFLVMYYSFFLSALLSILILPMFYTVDKRLRHSINGIGNKDFSYMDGYRSFFKENKMGYFGIILSFFLSLGSALLISLILAPATSQIMNIYPDCKSMYDHFKELLNNGALLNEISDFLVENGALMSKPLTILNGVIFFVPIFLFLFYFINENLDHHYISSIVLPDLDKNVSTSQARALAKASYGRGIYGYRQIQRWKNNWPFYLAFTIIYGGLVYANTLITIDNFFLLPIVVMLAPITGMMVGIYLSYFAKINEYAVIEESQDILLSTIPESMRISIRQTYNSPIYIHGEESAIRGPFIPEPSYSHAQEQQEVFIYEPDNESKEEKKESPKQENIGGVYDFSKTQKGEDDK